MRKHSFHESMIDTLNQPNFSNQRYEFILAQ